MSRNMIKRTERFFMIAWTIFVTMFFATAFKVNADYSSYCGDGWVQVTYGGSFGDVAAQYGYNYIDLAAKNGVYDVDNYVVQPGDMIYIGGDVAPITPDYTGQPAYNEYSTTYSYYDDYGNYCEGYTTLAYDGGAVDYGTVTTYDNSYSNQTYTESTYTTEQTYSSGVCTTGAAESLYNIGVACQLNNNIVIPAGGTYRASDYIGAGDASMGFVLAPCFDGQGGYVDGYGGGICSVTSSIYMAGKSAGLTTIEANQHNFGDGTTGITSYSPEDQAMYNYGTSDLVMVNNTGHDLVLSCTYGDNGISASFN